MSNPTITRKISTRESTTVTLLLIGVALTYLLLFLGLPLVAVFVEAFKKGWALYWAALQEPDAWSAIKLTFIAAAIAVPANLVFGVSAAWAIAKFEFKGKSLL
ncbi:MAG: sulfate transporter permease subunit CysW, partial [Pseudomonadota bacterium]